MSTMSTAIAPRHVSQIPCSGLGSAQVLRQTGHALYLASIPSNPGGAVVSIGLWKTGLSIGGGGRRLLGRDDGVGIAAIDDDDDDAP